MSKRPNAKKLAEEEAMILGSFLQFAETRSMDELARFHLHCGINTDDIEFAGDIPSAILGRYRRNHLDAVAHDWFRWPPIAGLLQRRAPPPSAA